MIVSAASNLLVGVLLACLMPLVGAGALQRVAAEVPTFEGIYQVMQKETGRYLDAYESAQPGSHHASRPGFEAVTRPLQHANAKDGMDRTQFWVISKDKGESYSLMQYTSGRLLDASKQISELWHLNQPVVTDIALGLDEDEGLQQSWYLQQAPGASDPNEVVIMQASSQLFMGAYADASKDHMVTLADVPEESRLWVMVRVGARPLSLFDGLYKLEQISTGRRLDAYHMGLNKVTGDTAVMTREVQFSPSQRFLVRRIRAEIYVFAQQSTGDLLGAQPSPPNLDYNYTIVTRDFQGDTSQQWMLMRQSYDEFVVVHVPSGRVVDAYQDENATGQGHDFRAYTARPSLACFDGNITSQLWRFRKIQPVPVLSGIYKLEQKATGRLLLASGEIVTTTAERLEEGQVWSFRRLAGDIYTIQLNGTDSFLEVPFPAGDSSVAPVARLADFAYNDTQLWYLVWLGDYSYRLRQHHAGRFLDTLPDGRAVTQSDRDVDTQTWDLVLVERRCDTPLSCPAVFQCGGMDNGCGDQVSCGSCNDRNPVTNVVHMCTTDHRCECVPRDLCDDGVVDGTQGDGCNGYIDCAEALGRKDSPKVEMGSDDETSTSALAPAPAPAPACLNATCNVGMDCGTITDSCGNDVPCGNLSGLCPFRNSLGGNLTCQDHQCVCVPDLCRNRCGKFQDGCGENITCGCELADQMCSADAGVCEHVEQPPPNPNMFNPPTPTPTRGIGSTSSNSSNASNASNASDANDANGSSASVGGDSNSGDIGEDGDGEDDGLLSDADGANANATTTIMPYVASSLGPAPAPQAATSLEDAIKPAPPPGLSPGDGGLTKDRFKKYAFYYYFFYYYHWLLFREAKVPREDAARRAQVLAKHAAQAQLRGEAPAVPVYTSSDKATVAGTKEIAAAAAEAAAAEAVDSTPTAEAKAATDEAVTKQPSVGSGGKAAHEKALGRLLWDRLMGDSGLWNVASLAASSLQVNTHGHSSRLRGGGRSGGHLGLSH